MKHTGLSFPTMDGTNAKEQKDAHISIILHFGEKREARHEIGGKEVEDYDVLLKELRGLAEKSFGVKEFKMSSREVGAAIDVGDDLEAEMEDLESHEFHINVIGEVRE